MSVSLPPLSLDDSEPAFLDLPQRKPPQQKRNSDFVLSALEGRVKATVQAEDLINRGATDNLFKRCVSKPFDNSFVPYDPDDPDGRNFMIVSLGIELAEESVKRVLPVFLQMVPPSELRTEEELKALIQLGNYTEIHDDLIKAAAQNLISTETSVTRNRDFIRENMPPDLISWLDLPVDLQRTKLKQLLKTLSRDTTVLDLSLFRGDLISDRIVQKIASDCPNLKSIRLYKCIHITDASVEALAIRCPKLQSLELNKCPQITNASIIALTTHCKNLQEIDHIRCKKIEDNPTQALMAGCPMLITLFLETVT